MARDLELEETNYYFITDEGADVPIEEQVETALDMGVRMIQYRKKGGTTRERYREALSIKRSCKGRGIFIVNDHVDIALAVEADGVHIGRDDLPPEATRELIGERILGITTHAQQQAKEAEGVADYVGIGPVHESSTKDGRREALGIEKTVKIAKELDIPTAAIGGVEEEDIEPLLDGVDMICAISSVTRDGDLGENIRYFEERIEDIKRGV